MRKKGHRHILKPSNVIKGWSSFEDVEGWQHVFSKGFWGERLARPRTCQTRSRTGRTIYSLAQLWVEVIWSTNYVMSLRLVDGCLGPTRRCRNIHPQIKFWTLQWRRCVVKAALVSFYLGMPIDNKMLKDRPMRDLQAGHMWLDVIRWCKKGCSPRNHSELWSEQGPICTSWGPHVDSRLDILDLGLPWRSLRILRL